MDVVSMAATVELAELVMHVLNGEKLLKLFLVERQVFGGCILETRIEIIYVVSFFLRLAKMSNMSLLSEEQIWLGVMSYMIPAMSAAVVVVIRAGVIEAVLVSSILFKR